MSELANGECTNFQRKRKTSKGESDSRGKIDTVIFWTRTVNTVTVNYWHWTWSHSDHIWSCESTFYITKEAAARKIRFEVFFVLNAELRRQVTSVGVAEGTSAMFVVSGSADSKWFGGVLNALTTKALQIRRKQSVTATMNLITKACDRACDRLHSSHWRVVKLIFILLL